MLRLRDVELGELGMFVRSTTSNSRRRAAGRPLISKLRKAVASSEQLAISSSLIEAINQKDILRINTYEQLHPNVFN